MSQAPPGPPYGEQPSGDQQPPPSPYGQPQVPDPRYGPGYEQTPTQAYGQYGQYGQPGQPGPYGQPPQGQGYPPPPYGYAPARPDHPKATHALIWGLVALVGGFMCAVPLLAAPVAWIVGVRARRAIDADPASYGGRGQATAGMVLGIIGTVLLALGIAAIVLFIVLIAGGAMDPETYSEYSTTNA